MNQLTHYSCQFHNMTNQDCNENLIGRAWFMGADGVARNGAGGEPF